MGVNFLRRLGLVILTLAFLLGGCACAEKSYFSFRELDFEAEVTGALYGVEFCAVVSLQTEGDGCVRRVDYAGDGVLSGLSVVERAGGDAVLMREGMQFSCGAEELSGLLSPIGLLLSDGELESVRRVGEETLLNLADGTSITLTKEGVPREVSNGDVSFCVIKWNAETA